MTTVRFNSVAEFLQELSLDLGLVDRQLVRLTHSYTPSGASPNIRHLSVVATARVQDTILRLDKYCGDLWGLGQDKDTQDKAGEVMRLLEAGCHEAGLELRAGVFE